MLLDADGSNPRKVLKVDCVPERSWAE